ncbi:MAG: hypothetical protein QXL28_05465 [Desulfurococcaceae archaeon]
MSWVSGTLVESVETKVRSLGRVLSEYVEKRFTGYVVYRNTSAGIYILIAMIDGNIVACRSIRQTPTARTIIYDGVDCCGVAMKYISDIDGVVEVYSLDRKIIIADLLTFPQSRTEESVILASALNTGAGIPVKAPPKPPTPPPPSKPPVSVAEKPPAPPPTPQPPAPPAAAKAPVAEAVVREVGVRIMDECVDPVTLYMIIKSSQLVESARELPGPAVLERIEGMIKEKKPKYIYLSGNVTGAALRVVYDSQANGVSVELEKSGTSRCGKAVVDEVRSKSVTDVKIWIAV